MPVPCLAITTRRLKDWGQRCAKANSTPVLMLAVGHDHKSGELRIFTTEDTRDEDIILMLRAALDQLAAKGAPK